MNKAPFILSVALLLSSLSSNAAVLVGWDFNDLNATPDTVAAGITVTDNAISYDGTTPAPAGRFDGSQTAGSYIYPSGTAAAVADGAHYYEFTISGADSLDVLGFTLGSARLATGRNVAFQVLYGANGANPTTALSIDGYSTVEADYTSPTGTTTFADVTSFTIGQNGTDLLAPSAGTIFATAIIDLSGLASATTHTFRIAYNKPSNNGGALFDDVEVHGTAVPEPSATAALIGLGALVMCLVRRRRK